MQLSKNVQPGSSSEVENQFEPLNGSTVCNMFE